MPPPDQTSPPVPDPTKRPTLKTVAEISGLAVATVSRALADDPKIAKATRTRVARIADAIGYEPDRAARRLRTGRTMVVNLILDPHFEVLGFGNALLMGLSRSLEGTGYNLVVTPHFTDEDSLRPIRHIVTNRRADGVIFTRVAPFDARVRFLLERGFPFVCHGRTEFTEPHSWVDFDNETFAYLAAMRLVKLGCEEIGALWPSEALTFRQHLHYGMMRAVRETGIRYHVPESVTLDSPMTQIRAWAQELAEAPGGPDGFICPGEASWLAIRNGFRAAGRTCKAVVKSISGIISEIDPGIDFVHEDVEEAGRLMGEQLLCSMGDPGLPPRQTLQHPIIAFRD